jgi:cytochrome c556
MIGARRAALAVCSGLLAAALLLSDGVEERADAHTGATGVVKQRMTLMGGFADAMKAIKAAVTAKPDMDRAAIAAAARKIADHARRVPALFPEGSDGHPSEARPEIWRSWQGFVKANAVMRAEATKLAEVAPKGERRAVLGQFARTARACGACHKTFREAAD